MNHSCFKILDYKVLVECMTYNQSIYIEDALTGFAMQNTNFPYVCLVMDDASTDGEQAVIKSWIEKECDLPKSVRYDIPESEVIIVPHKTNLSCVFAFYFLKVNLFNTDKKEHILKEWRLRSEYEAFCEGDDYWVNPLKLEKQVEFMDTHPEVDICAHSWYILDSFTGKKKKCIRSFTECTFSTEKVIVGGGDFVATASLLLRTSKVLNPSEFRRFFKIDYSLQIDGALRGGMGYLPECMSVYRHMAQGSWSVRSSLNKSLHSEFQRRREQMLDILDREQKGRFHKAIQARRLKDAVSNVHLSRKEKQNALSKYKDGFGILPLKARLRVLAKSYLQI